MNKNKEDYISKFHKLENKASISRIRNHLNECRFDVRINSIDDFYNKFDENQPENRCLNSEFESYLLNKIEKIDFLPNLKIHVHCPSDFSLPDEIIKRSCINHFEKQAISQFHQNHLLKRKWIKGLILGIFFLGICLLASNFLRYPQFESKRFCRVLSESFSIIGWVAIWEPAYYLLFNKKQDKRKLRNAYVLHSAEYFVDRD